ncbi:MULTISPECIES: universal stress protein [unclassified Kitasatospora]|uniref:universal stress protein n=1 Tax=unclassified Kitasatospora TaxID=2633591 RepID=UPI0033EE4125
MTGPVVVGFDGSPESLTATAWAAREAQRRNCPLHLLQAWPWPHRDVADSERTHQRSVEQLAARESELRAAVEVPVSSSHVPAAPAEALEDAARDAALLVLGSRGLGAVRGFLVGSVSQEVLRRAACPVVLVRAGEDEPDGPVLVGLDLAHPADDVLAFAFDAAARRSAPLRVVHVWSPPVGTEYMAFDAIGGLQEELSSAERTRFTELLEPWRARRPEVEVTTDLIRGSAGVALVDAAATARLLVVGRRVRRTLLGSHLGPVAHAAIHHVHCPVALVPHD